MNEKKRKLTILLIVALLGATSCADIVMEEQGTVRSPFMDTAVGMHTVRVTSEPDGAKIMLVSMGNRQMQTYYAPAEIKYILTPAMPTVLTVVKKGYKPKNVRLEGKRKEVHVVLEKAPLSQMEYGGRGGFGQGAGPTDLGAGGTMGPGDIPGLTPMDQGKK